MTKPRKPTIQELETLLKDVEEVLDRQGFLLDLNMPQATIVGDLHGDWESYLHIKRIRRGGMIFLGDVVDRGPGQIELLMDIFRAMITEEGKVFFLRGNHETRDINTKWGFKKVLKKEYEEDGEYVWERINQTFDKLPVCAVLNRTYFLTHGGVSEHYKSLGDIRKRGPGKKLLPGDQGLMWNDPGGHLQEYPFVQSTYRSRAKDFNDRTAEEFCTASGLQAVIRGHQCVPDGYLWTRNKRVLTVFSIPGYRDGNMGAVAMVDDRKITIETFG